MEKSKQLERLLWSIALPGFGQILNRKYLKGILFILLEVLINTNSSLNQAIIYSYYGNFDQAVQIVDYQWLMFYPCVYLFSIFDAYKDAGGATRPYAFLPFVFAAYFGTVGLIYSKVLLGPVLLPILFIFLGAIVGYFFSSLLFKNTN